LFKSDDVKLAFEPIPTSEVTAGVFLEATRHATAVEVDFVAVSVTLIIILRVVLDSLPK
jgi:hypothetical protein